MTKYLGSDYRMLIKQADDTTYEEILGQQNLAVNRSAGEIDTSTKDEFPYGSSANGSRRVQIPFTMIPSLPDANGYERLVTLANGTAAFGIQIINTADGDAVVFECDVRMTDRNNSLDLNAAGAASGTLVNAAPPTVDDL